MYRDLDTCSITPILAQPGCEEAKSASYIFLKGFEASHREKYPQVSLTMQDSVQLLTVHIPLRS